MSAPIKRQIQKGANTQIRPYIWNGIMQFGEMNNNLPELPKGWVWTRLGDISTKITKGSTPTSYGFTYKSDGIKFIKTENITENGIIRDINDFIDEATNRFLKRSILKTNDILFSIAGTIGRVGVVKEHNLPANTNQALGIIRCPWDFISNKYIFHFLKSPFILKSATDSIVGVGRANISLTNLREFLIPLPPLPEQHRIVAKIEELFTRLDAGVEALKKIKSQLKRYRQAVLKYAFEGKLTQQWRENVGAYGNTPIEPASTLLERIKEQRNQKTKTVGANLRVRPNDGQTHRSAPTIDISELPELPDGWVWTRLGEIAEKINPGFPCGKFNKESRGVPHLRPMNISAKGDIDLSNLKYIEEKDYEPLLKGDILFNNTNSPELLGKTSYIKQNTNWAYSNHMTRIRVYDDFINPAWIAYVLHHLFLIGYFKMNCIHHVNQASINTNFLAEKVFIPLPPLPEQHQIVSEIEARFSVADQIEKIVEQSLKQAERLRQSILKRAFEGKLVLQDPTDEPAEKLLERIKEEKLRNQRTFTKQKRR